MAKSDSPSSVILQNVLALIKTKLNNDKVALAQEFVLYLYQQISEQDLAQRNDSDMYGAGIGLWNSLNQRNSHEPYIKVYNPSLDKHGWQSTHSVIEIIVDDMPFLVDSVQMTLQRLNIGSHLVLHQPMGLGRDKQGKVSQISIKTDDLVTGKLSNETVFLIEIDRQADEANLKQLQDELSKVLKDVDLVVSDWRPLKAKLESVIKQIEQSKYRGEEAHKEQVVAFLTWLANHNLTLMGYREYQIEPVAGDHKINPVMDTSLGLMRKGQGQELSLLSQLPKEAQAEAASQELLILTKTNVKSSVHRPAYIDHIGIKQFNKQGRVIGEHRFIGLYASSLYNSSATQIPMVRQKVERIMDGSGLLKGSHAYKALVNVLETFPRDELLQAKEAELLQIGTGVLQMQERDMTRLFVRKDAFGRYISCIVFVTKERFNTALRVKTQQILARYFKTQHQVEFNTYFTEGVLARTHYLVRVDDIEMTVDVKEIENNLIEAARSWDDKVQAALFTHFGEAKGNALAKRYVTGFPRAYKADMLAGSALADIQALEALNDCHTLGMQFYRAQEEQSDSQNVKLKLFHKNQPIHLSDVLPMLENMGLRVIGETPYAVKISDGSVGWILDFSMTYTGSVNFKIEQRQHDFQQAFANVWSGELEDDGFNRLVLGAELTGHETVILRAYAKYMRQTGTTFSQSYIEAALNRYPNLARLLVEIFDARFNPHKDKGRQQSKLKDAILAQLDEVANLDDDRIIRHFLEMILATIRTNYYQVNSQGVAKSYLSLKIKPNKISDMPRPRPAFEIFVYAPDVEGVHLRGGKVARGGLRWSDRREDFRTEVLGLVKAQQVKNTVIVPVGAKGGFVCKKQPEGDRAAIFAEGQRCYRIFIRALLDITDNIVNGEIVPPLNVVRHDEDDPYLVVAADKGTATFSDIANEISAEYNFWLGDAFASGGSQGYDHKKMGITAKGAWESVKRHFKEMGIDCQTTDFTCVGIGDMAGDVFGNGMLLSKHIRLQAAFNHMHIFIDPSPDAASTWQERKRLFDLPGSSWADYNSELISKGGGIFLRSAKSITLTPEIKAMIGSKRKTMAPNELIRELLQMQVDLLWNGGIGTYIKSKQETDAQVGDRANDAVRVNGHEVNAKIVGEGGNLGCTQLGRIEFAASGGRIDTDFIDNVGGVDCSDNEVNIKILLNGLVNDGELTIKQRNKLLVDMTSNVSDIVLTNAYRQAQSISVTQNLGAESLKEQIRFIHGLEKEKRLDRALEYLPSDDELSERLAQNQGLTRPELCVLLAYGKMVLKQTLNCPEITDDGYLAQSLVNSFPRVLQQKYAAQMAKHPLRGEIIATQIANQIVNDMGLNFVARLSDETGATDGEIAKCYVMAREVFDLDSIWRQVEALDNQVSAQTQLAIMSQTRRTIRRATRWFLRLRNRSWTISENIEFYKPAYQQLHENLLNILVPEEVKVIEQQSQALVEQGLPEALASTICQQDLLFSALDLAQISEQQQRTIMICAEIYFNLGSKLELHWFLDQINGLAVDNHWQALARASFREELDWQQRSLASGVLSACHETDFCGNILDTWLQRHEGLLARWHHMLADFKTSSTHEFAKFSVALRELNLLNLNCLANTEQE
ncbi:NAD-glutamate dehydrogenase [Motilimonas eburnea]|uniref:NAD-glutamate dehydrogenase n=1 Tax=Motilimonas eburnea TaxID=1737488 RepID=UPI001E61C23E|nr:NAD-glutamate dehydrogenase [Motilimonas eburnea]MCE2571938.1 NAD-glutamate dehydrogenase [Motilimonas eburnea]